MSRINEVHRRVDQLQTQVQSITTWAAVHETGCDARHQAIEVRLQGLDGRLVEMRSAAERRAERQNAFIVLGFRVIGRVLMIGFAATALLTLGNSGKTGELFLKFLTEVFG